MIYFKLTCASFFLLLLLITSCTPKHQTSEITDQADTVAVLIKDTLPETKELHDPFLTAVSQFAIDFPKYQLRSMQTLDTLTDASQHWFLSIIKSRRETLENTNSDYAKKELVKLPTETETQLVNYIRQAVCYQSNPKSKDILFEEWNFTTNHQAERWLVLLKDSLRGNYYTKPPRFQWVEDNRLLLVATRSAASWFELGDSLVFQLTGKTKSQISRLYQPLNLPHFKKWNGPANSTITATDPYLYVDSVKQHYQYFYFKKHSVGSPVPSPKEFRVTTSLHQRLKASDRYESLNETLVGIQCGIAKAGLTGWELVGKPSKDLDQLLGESIYSSGGTQFYGHSNRIVVAKLEEESVSMFKYLRLSKPFSELKNDQKALQYLLNFE